MCHAALGGYRWLFGVALGRADREIMKVHGIQLTAPSPLLVR